MKGDKLQPICPVLEYSIQPCNSWSAVGTSSGACELLQVMNSGRMTASESHAGLLPSLWESSSYGC